MLGKYFLGKYFDDKPFGPRSDAPYYTKDEDGIIQINYPETNRMAPGAGQQYHPTLISTYALSQFNMFMDNGDEHSKRLFLKYADWLVDNLYDRDGFAAWNFNFAWKTPGYKCKAPWISSMAQGMGCSVLARAWELTGDARYIATADRALSAFEVPVSRGGLLRVDKQGDAWYEGTPSPIGAQVLNEVLFSLIGLYELHLSTGNIKAGELFHRGITTVRKHLKDFDLNLLFFKWSRYDNRLLFYSGDKYHDVQTEQLKWLSQAIGDDLLDFHYKKWKDWQKKYNSRKHFSSKLLFQQILRGYGIFLRFYTKYLQR